MEDQLVALRSVAAARGLDALDEAADLLHIVREIEGLGDVGGAGVAVVAVGDDADPHPRDLLHQPGDGGFDLLPNLGEARIHAAGGVKAEDDLDAIVDHG